MVPLRWLLLQWQECFGPDDVENGLGGDDMWGI